AMSALPRQPTPAADTPPVAALPATSREILERIRKAYTFLDAVDEAAAFSILAQRPDVAAVLLSALPHVREVFDNDTQVLLITVDDHTDAPLRLSARIVTTESLPEALAKRDAFYRTWWSNASDTILGDLSFGLLWPRDQ
ncbi:MAG: hypothetical protein KC442_12460, partial [Thermomicrobiales bacterium]|nr:hypothetical protein [Thermomicrobiales bacterium]